VPPAPSGSLDATLAAARLPLFALDFRAAPEWFRQARGSRQIGAIYPEGEPYALIGDIVAPEAYDAVLFVEATTAARKNPGRRLPGVPNGPTPSASTVDGWRDFPSLLQPRQGFVNSSRQVLTYLNGVGVGCRPFVRWLLILFLPTFSAPLAEIARRADSRDGRETTCLNPPWVFGLLAVVFFVVPQKKSRARRLALLYESPGYCSLLLLLVHLDRDSHIARIRTHRHTLLHAADEIGPRAIIRFVPEGDCSKETPSWREVECTVSAKGRRCGGSAPQRS